MNQSNPGPVIVGSLGEFPVGARLARLLRLPATATSLACFQFDNTAHQDLAARLLALPGAPPAGVREAYPRISNAVSFFSAPGITTMVHPAASVADLRAALDTGVEALSPAEGALARRKTEAESLAAIEDALRITDGLPKKGLKTWLGKASKKFIDANADQRTRVFVAQPESMNVVDQRLFNLWCYSVAATSFLFPMPPSAPELGFDRRSLFAEGLRAAGVAPAVVETAMLSRWAPVLRGLRSTALWVWEQIAADPRAFSRRVLDIEEGAKNLAMALLSMGEIPLAIHEDGALADLRAFCADASLVPDATLAVLDEDPVFHALLPDLARHGVSAPFRPFPASKSVVGVPLRELDHLD